jgi:hypothetical protein
MRQLTWGSTSGPRASPEANVRTIQIDGDIVNALAATVAQSAEFVLQAPLDPQ